MARKPQGRDDAPSERKSQTEAGARQLDAYLKRSFVPRKGPPDARRRVLERMTALLEPTCPPGSVSARLGSSEAMARTLEQIGLDPVDFDELIHEAHEDGFAVSHLERLDRRRVLELTVWEAIEALTRPKPQRGRPPGKEDDKGQAATVEESED